MLALDDEIRVRMAAFAPLSIALVDESAAHAGHAGAAGGGKHYRLSIVSSAFDGMSRIARHRVIYDKLADLIPHPVHAIAIDARTPAEAAR